jgi:hypothetical protein
MVSHKIVPSSSEYGDTVSEGEKISTARPHERNGELALAERRRR